MRPEGGIDVVALVTECVRLDELSSRSDGSLSDSSRSFFLSSSFTVSSQKGGGSTKNNKEEEESMEESLQLVKLNRIQPTLKLLPSPVNLTKEGDPE
jgi:hypothetical protein